MLSADELKAIRERSNAVLLGWRNEDPAMQEARASLQDVPRLLAEICELKQKVKDAYDEGERDVYARAEHDYEERNQ